MSIFFSVLAVIFTLMFPMNEAAAAVVRQQLDERRLAKAAAGQPTDEVAEEFVHEHPRQTEQFVEQHPEIASEEKRKDRES
jgi:hypothetical protein